MTRRDHVADGLATAMLAGPWTRDAVGFRCQRALDRSQPPRWLDELVDQVFDAYRDAPADRPRELAAYLQTCPAWAKAWAHRRTPRVAVCGLDPVLGARLRAAYDRIDWG